MPGPLFLCRVLFGPRAPTRDVALYVHTHTLAEELLDDSGTRSTVRAKRRGGEKSERCFCGIRGGAVRTLPAGIIVFTRKRRRGGFLLS